MSNLSDSWLDSLVRHPIFELTEGEKKNVESVKQNQTRQQQTSIGDFILQHHNRVIALRDNDLFIAIGTQIRVLNLTEFKDAWLTVSKNANEDSGNISDNWIHSVSYKVLDTPDINFSIESMLPNTNGRLLSVTGHSCLVIVCLPRQGFSGVSESSISRKKIDCRTLSVGSKYYETSGSSILKVEWHPLSETHTHIVVLGSENTLRIFDISTDIAEPEQEFDLSPVEARSSTNIQSRGGFSIDDEDDGDEDAVTFTLGGPSQDVSGWEPFTVFYALRSGHIYTLCPVIPFRSIVRRTHLDNLSCISQVKYEQCRSTDNTLSHLFKLHNEWINYLFGSAQIGHNKLNQLDSDTLTVTSSHSHVGYTVQRQGPYLINYTQALDNGIQATDILYINAESINIIALAMNNGTVHNYILGSEVDAQWQLPAKNFKFEWQKELALLLSGADFLPRATLYEVINLKSEHVPAFQRVSLVADPLYRDTYYAYHAGGVHAIAMEKWLKKLAMLSSKFESGNNADSDKGISEWLSRKETSKIRKLVDSSPFAAGFVPIIGLVLITDIYLSYSMLTIACDYRLVTRDLNMRRDLAAAKQSDTAVKEQLKNIVDDDSGYQPLLSLPVFQPPKQLDNLPKQAKIVVPADLGGSKEVVITEETLRFFAKSSEQIRRETHDLKKAASKIDSRLIMQQKEFERQVTTLRDLYHRLQKVRSPDAKTAQEEKVKELSQRHAKLRLRIDEQLRKLMNTYQPDLSNEEKEWIGKLEKIEKQVDGDAGYVARIALLQSQIKELNVKAEKTPISKVPNISATQLNSVLRSLKEQTNSINDAKQRINNLDSKLSTTIA